MPGGCWLDIVVAQSGLQRKRLLQWIIAWTGLSAAWFIGDGDDPAVDLAVSAWPRRPWIGELLLAPA